MTISTTTTTNRYTGNAATTVFPYTFRILNATDLVVTKRSASTLVETTLNYPADYSVSGVGNTTGGSVTLAAAPATGDLLVIERSTARTQATSIRNQGSYFPETHENVFDKLTMLVQENTNSFGRTFTLPKTLDPASYNMNLPVPVAGQVPIWTTNGLTNGTISSGNVVLPGEGRDTTTLTQYLANNYVYNVVDYNADPTTTVDSTAAILSAFNANGVVGGKAVYLPRGTYKISAGGVILDNPNSLVVSGAAPGFSTALQAADAVGPVLTLGNGTFEPFSLSLRDFTIDVNGKAAPSGLYLRRLNLMNIDNLEIKNVTSGAGLRTDPTSPLMQELYFRRLAVYGSGTTQGIGVELYPTGNVEFEHCNIENVLRALYVRSQILTTVSFAGGHFERCIWAIDAEDAQLVFFGTTLFRGQLWLGSGCHAGRVIASPHSSSISEAGVSDLGFGNKITLAGGVRTDGKAQSLPAISTDGEEWLRTPTVVDDPLFTKGVSSWTATNATITDGKAGMPGAKRGRSLIVQGTLANGYASKTFAAEASTDYLLSVAFIVTANNAANARVQVLDESSTSLYDSGTITYPAPTADGQRVRIHRKRIPTSAGTGKQLTVRIYSVGTTNPTIVPLLLLSKSSVTFASQVVTSGSGNTTAGSGTTFAVSQTVDTGSWFLFNSGVRHRGPCFAYFNVTACPNNASPYAGVQTDANGANAGIQYQLDTSPREYCLILPSFPDDGTIKFYAFAGSGTLTVSDFCLMPIAPPGEPWPLLLVDGATVNLTLGVAREYLWNANGSRTLGAVPAGFDGKTFTLTENNITAGAVTTTFPASYKLAGGAWTDPATTKRRSITFRIEGSTAYELHRSSGDV